MARSARRGAGRGCPVFRRPPVRYSCGVSVEPEAMRWTPDAILAQSAAWRSSWHPSGSTYFTVDGYEFYEQDGEATLLNYRGPHRDADEIVDAATEIATTRGAHAVLVTVGPGPLERMSTELLDARDARTVAVVDVVAMILDEPAGGVEAPDDVRCIKATDLHTRTVFGEVSLRAWGFAPPILTDPESGHDDDRAPGLFVALCAGTPAGAGGYSLSGEVARLWGAAVLSDFRRRGVYRALIAERIRDARARGATLALVHAEQTSAPILQRWGFVKFGERSRVRIPTGARVDR